MVLENQENHEVIVLSQEDHSLPLNPNYGWMLDFKNIKRLPGPRFSDGTINWQCPCMAGGSLVAHRCGHQFRQLYICMSENDHDDVTVKCPDQFINWSACMQNVSGSIYDDGRINIECPCLHSPLAHRCGHLLREAVQCTNSSKTNPRGTDCVDHFIEYDLCLRSFDK
ncbi:unnamed protein product [Auanema sp. JU1783]|nr:unnamed protein product [Auanema sp. JU1783]